jgi:hypothetical protein
MHKKFQLKNHKGRDHTETPGIPGRILTLILKKINCEGVAWIQLAQNRVQWWPLVTMVMNLLDP